MLEFWHFSLSFSSLALNGGRSKLSTMCMQKRNWEQRSLWLASWALPTLSLPWLCKGKVKTQKRKKMGWSTKTSLFSSPLPFLTFAEHLYILPRPWTEHWPLTWPTGSKLQCFHSWFGGSFPFQLKPAGSQNCPISSLPFVPIAIRRLGMINCVVFGSLLQAVHPLLWSPSK